MKWFIVLLFTLIVLLPLTTQLVVIDYFYANQNEISSTFCVNKNLPEKKCDGKCYLGNSLKKIDDTQNQSSSTPSQKTKIEVNHFFSTNSIPELAPILSNQLVYHDSRYLDGYSFDWNQTLEIPPTL